MMMSQTKRSRCGRRAGALRAAVALLLALLMVLPAGTAVFAADIPQITETKDGYSGNIGWEGGLRKKSSGEILFSPYITEIKALTDSGRSPDEFTAEMTFSLLSGDKGEVVYTFPAVHQTLTKSRGNYFDIFLQGPSDDVGFCPTAGKYYNIAVVIYEDYTGAKTAICQGTYKSLLGAEAISSSPYYNPTSVPKDPSEYDLTFTYTPSNDLAGSAAGEIAVTGSSEGVFGVYWLNDAGAPLSATIGELTLPYSPLVTFSFDDSGDQTFTHTLQSFTAIPAGAAKIALCENSSKGEKVIESVDIPAEKKPAASDPAYSFGVLSDIHYNYFHSGGESMDDADNAFDTALRFFEDAGASLVTTSGDYSKYAEEDSYKKFAAAAAKVDIPVLSCSGNHEMYATKEAMFGKNGLFRRYMNKGVYDETPMAGVKTVADNGIDFTYEIPGQEDSVFIFFNLCYWNWMGSGYRQPKMVDTEQITWLSQQLEQYKDRKVYFYFHVYLNDDDDETYDGEGDLTNNAFYSYDQGYSAVTSPDGAALRALLSQYRNVVFFNGHSHYSYDMQQFNENLNIFDYEGTTATMVHVPSVTAPRTVTADSPTYSALNGKASQGALMQVYDGYDLMNAIDFTNNQILSYATYIIYDKGDAANEDLIVEGKTADGKVTWTYDAQTLSLRFTGDGEITSADAAALEPYKTIVRRVYIGKGITLVGQNVFSGFTALQRAELKEGVTSIGESAFKGDSALSEVILPSSLAAVKTDAFASCDAIASFVFEGTAADLAKVEIESGNDALTGAPKSFLSFTISFTVGEETTTQTLRRGKLPVYEGETPVKLASDPEKIYPFTGWSDDKNVLHRVGQELPRATADAVYTARFASDPVDRYVRGEDGVSYELDRATGVLSITGEGSTKDYTVDLVAPWAAYASEIFEVRVMPGITRIGNRAFSKLSSMRTARVAEGVKVLGQDAFSYATVLSTVYLPVSLNTVGQGAFYQSNALETIYYRGSEKDWQGLVKGITSQYNETITDFSGDIIYGIYDLGGALAGDFDNDGALQVTDVSALLTFLAQPDGVTPYTAPDLTGDGAISAKDVSRLLRMLEG